MCESAADSRSRKECRRRGWQAMLLAEDGEQSGTWTWTALDLSLTAPAVRASKKAAGRMMCMLEQY